MADFCLSIWILLKSNFIIIEKHKGRGGFNNTKIVVYKVYVAGILKRE